MSRPFVPRSPSNTPFVRINGKIRAREVRVIGDEGEQLGILSLGDAINLARNKGVDLVEIAPNATPPVCRLVDFGKFRYEQAKKEKEAKKHQHANKVKEIQLSPQIDPHDFSTKLTHAIDFLCEDMKVKVTLRFRGREMAHQEYGFEKIHTFIKDVAAWGHPDSPPKLIGKGITLMLSPHPRAKRAKHPDEGGAAVRRKEEEEPGPNLAPSEKAKKPRVATNATEEGAAFGQNPFASVNIKG
ncbi:MAG: translation initiation factor IF-3 [Verrucomicrobiota bacterium]|nr:translation initiation factor IF-3 [Verrucomicrobiota bacterium]